MITKPKHISSSPGVYIFRRGTTPIYIGKAVDLKRRVSSYFRRLASDKVRQLRQEATALEWLELHSDIEALIQEAALIKEHLPKFNVLMRDDKSYFYVVFTKEEFPRVFVVHKTNLEKNQYQWIVGPFTSGSALRAVLRLLRRTFPYCTCTMPHKRPCLNAQINRCPGFCCAATLSHSSHPPYSLIRTNKRIDKTSDHLAYRGNIRKIIAVLSGKRKRLLTQFKKEMRDTVKKQDFEHAAILRDQMENIENVFQHRGILEYTGLRRRMQRPWHPIEKEIRHILETDRKISRVEGYDISNISGTEATGSMVVFISGRPAKSEYRKFKIKTVHGANDPAMHTEMMRRRIEHPEWPYPDLIVMDGGKPQLNAAIAAWRVHELKHKGKIPVITALAKREEELYSEGGGKPTRLDALSPATMHFFQHVRDESHRFAKKYHHKLREISYRENLKNQN